MGNKELAILLLKSLISASENGSEIPIQACELELILRLLEA